ncbi:MULTISPECIES: molecular chaperone [unclassified Serratia (in: enterobacteria)]|uniref:fimbrial biogenesis chaperone n=1 Tax=unclassified Serratia (in: enterobacteria) TaxID=2647522 RepID=UPI000502B5A0|nr:MULTISPECIES: molecular chaperone [unclassified Serratia (in: enterobacteria)]KFK93155.1 long polar fimbrial chaperone LpfB [Serratia sp. Ag2]KFK99594.1 long polar fimbrial chaperone LpfB [Serratia sp. Ag1]
MKKFPTVLVASLMVIASATQAGVIVGGTRLIYDGAKKESSLSVNNPDKMPYLIQSWVESTTEGGEKAPFMITPPLFRLNSGQENVLRVVYAGNHLPSDKESLYWLNIKSIPATQKEESENKNTLQIAIKTRIKLIYRPAGLKGSPEEATEKLSWQRSGNSLKVTNPTPFYMNFQEVKVAGQEVEDATYVAPGATASFALPAGANSNNVSWKIINDYGAMGKEHRSTL